MAMHHVIVGAGAVGIVYADALLRAGDEVTFLVREKYVDEVKSGVRLYRGRDTRTVTATRVTSNIADLRKNDVDAIWLTVPSNALLDADWVKSLMAAVPNASVVEFSGGLEAGAVLRKFVDEDRIVDGLISYLAWQTPLPDNMEKPREPGIALYCPPGPESVFGGARAEPLVASLRRGGLLAKFDPRVAAQRTTGSALLSAFIIALEVAHWKLNAAPAVFGDAGQQALRIAERETGRSAGMLHFVARPFVVGIVLKIAALLMPLPLEAYLAFHFQKVQTQMHGNLRSMLARAAVHKIPVPDLQRLSDALAATSSSSSLSADNAASAVLSS